MGRLAHDPDGVNVNLKWAERKLCIGDQIRIKVVQTSKVDRPRSRKREDPGLDEKQKRRYYKRLKRECDE